MSRRRRDASPEKTRRSGDYDKVRRGDEETERTKRAVPSKDRQFREKPEKDSSLIQNGDAMNTDSAARHSTTTTRSATKDAPRGSSRNERREDSRREDSSRREDGSQGPLAEHKDGKRHDKSDRRTDRFKSERVEYPITQPKREVAERQRGGGGGNRRGQRINPETDDKKKGKEDREMQPVRKGQEDMPVNQRERQRRGQQEDMPVNQRERQRRGQQEDVPVNQREGQRRGQQEDMPVNQRERQRRGQQEDVPVNQRERQRRGQQEDMAGGEEIPVDPQEIPRKGTFFEHDDRESFLFQEQTRRRRFVERPPSDHAPSWREREEHDRRDVARSRERRSRGRTRSENDEANSNRNGRQGRWRREEQEMRERTNRWRRDSDNGGRRREWRRRSDDDGGWRERRRRSPARWRHDLFEQDNEIVTGEGEGDKRKRPLSSGMNDVWSHDKFEELIQMETETVA